MTVKARWKIVWMDEEGNPIKFNTEYELNNADRQSISWMVARGHTDGVIHDEYKDFTYSHLFGNCKSCEAMGGPTPGCLECEQRLNHRE